MIALTPGGHDVLVQRDDRQTIKLGLGVGDVLPMSLFGSLQIRLVFGVLARERICCLPLLGLRFGAFLEIEISGRRTRRLAESGRGGDPPLSVCNTFWDGRHNGVDDAL